MAEVFHSRISEDLRLAVVQSREPFSEMGREPRELRRRSLFHEFDG
jgi:hypothetical protein